LAISAAGVFGAWRLPVVLKARQCLRGLMLEDCIRKSSLRSRP
jgi:hypothetical protein